MADADSYHKPQQQLVSKIGSSIPPNQEDPRKFSSHFIYKAFFVAVFLVVLPFFPSQAPQFINQNVLTRSWELLHLLLVGIAVSYGLFSRRNVETEKENQSKFDSAQNYVSKILQVSSVFDDEAESPFGSDENKVQTWNSRYFRGEPVVLVAQENSLLNEQNHSSSNISNKPLLLPVRSLRSRVSEQDDIESINEYSGFSGSLSGSSSSSKSSSNNSVKNRKREIEIPGPLDLEEKLKQSAVLPSPIPWRSRSGRMEMKEEVGTFSPPLYSLPPSVDDSEFDQFESRSFGSPLSWSSRASSTASSPKKLSPSHSLSPELRAKTVEDLGRKKSFYKPSPPPPPPPPPPISRRSPLITSNSIPMSSRFSSDKNDSKRSFKDELKDLSRNSRDDLPSRANLGLNSLNSEVQNRTHLNGSSMGKSVREITEGEPIAGARKAKDSMAGKRSKEVEGRKIGGFEQMSIRAGKQIRESPRLTPNPTISKYQEEEMKEFAEKVIIESEEDSDNDFQGSSDIEEAVSTTVSNARPDPNEVDKKADEFIAKFREQIRLQRIELIKKSSGQRSSRNSSSWVYLDLNGLRSPVLLRADHPLQQTKPELPLLLRTKKSTSTHLSPSSRLTSDHHLRLPSSPDRASNIAGELPVFEQPSSSPIC
ncbi:hypothetical protein HHK36_028042 [Tetracentron sinense]|uniref:Uncharacterized protein n=1 Tax=Tetracentron sinense TaxID=13715 RepID=A0A834YFW4_TETSI|nr:hypothetical protein HHK36_028042 [Tetracentron sinense]